MQRIDELMVRAPITVLADAPVAECIRRLARDDIRHLPVVDDTGRLLGVLTDFDLMRPGLTGCAGDLVAGQPIRAYPGSLLSDVLATQIARGCEAVVVVDDDARPLGIVTEHDAVAMAAERIPASWRVDASARPVVSVDHADKACDVWQRMRDHRIRHVVVMRDGEAWSVLSWRDLASEGVSSADARTAGDLVRYGELHAMPPAGRLRDAANTMVRRRIGCIPVLDGGRPVAILTRTDIIDTLLSVLQTT